MPDHTLFTHKSREIILIVIFISVDGTGAIVLGEISYTYKDKYHIYIHVWEVMIQSCRTMEWKGGVVLTRNRAVKETQTFQLETQQYTVEDFCLVLFRAVG